MGNKQYIVRRDILNSLDGLVDVIRNGLLKIRPDAPIYKITCSDKWDFARAVMLATNPVSESTSSRSRQQYIAQLDEVKLLQSFLLSSYKLWIVKFGNENAINHR
ncbi:hypothetical protein WS98_10120 [Burkholderia territorii]|nr:hypothetical protein WS98_10120 [Burkholderia territorii]KWE37949.1 hypothetical protein WT49_09280 [Burkholderia territorii]KWE41766.1 hypothetical protein WT50_02495 [Burkholderia territorii]KWE43131.1 hypothetical protein WT51_22875 [Burkholderia territorii]